MHVDERLLQKVEADNCQKKKNRLCPAVLPQKPCSPIVVIMGPKQKKYGRIQMPCRQTTKAQQGGDGHVWTSPAFSESYFEIINVTESYSTILDWDY